MTKSAKILSDLKSAGSLTAYGRTIWADGKTAPACTIRKRTIRWLRRHGIVIPKEMHRAGRPIIKSLIDKEVIK